MQTVVNTTSGEVLSTNLLPCVICGDTSISASGKTVFECTNKEHVYCETCFEGMIKSQCETPNISEWMKQGGRVKCSLCDYIFSDQYLAKKVSPEVYDIYQKSIEKFLEQKIQKDFSDEFEQRLKNAQQETVTDTQTVTAGHVRHIIENILTLKCPNCETAFHKFDGCLSVKCQKCDKDFCGTGCGYYSKDAHQHIRNGCKYTSGYLYIDQNDIKQIQNKIKGEKINTYLNQFDSELRGSICLELEKHIQESTIKEEYSKKTPEPKLKLNPDNNNDRRSRIIENLNLTRDTTIRLKLRSPPRGRKKSRYLSSGRSRSGSPSYKKKVSRSPLVKKKISRSPSRRKRSRSPSYKRKASRSLIVKSPLRHINKIYPSPPPSPTERQVGSSWSGLTAYTIVDYIVNGRRESEPEVSEEQLRRDLKTMSWQRLMSVDSDFKRCLEANFEGTSVQGARKVRISRLLEAVNTEKLKRQKPEPSFWKRLKRYITNDSRYPETKTWIDTLLDI